MRGATGEPICPYSYLRTTEDTHANVSHPRPSASQRHQTVHTYYDWLCLGSCVRRYHCKEHGWRSKAAHAAGPQCGPCRPNGTPQYTTGHCWTQLDTTALVAPSRPTPQCRISIIFTSRLGLTINNYCFANEY